MAEAFKDADIVSQELGPFAAMEKSTNLYAEGAIARHQGWRRSCLPRTPKHKDWCCTEELMNTTKDGKALYPYCPPADINQRRLLQRTARSRFPCIRPLSYPLYQRGFLQAYIIAAQDPVLKPGRWKALRELMATVGSEKATFGDDIRFFSSMARQISPPAPHACH